MYCGRLILMVYGLWRNLPGIQDSLFMYCGRLTPLNQHVYVNVLWLIQSSKTELMVSALGVAQVYNPAFRKHDCTVLDSKQ